MQPLLFLSHAGIDSQAALDLAGRIEAAPDAVRAGLKVWIDKRDLLAGQGWQAQLEAAIRDTSTCFGMYVGSRGAVNWVDAEIRVGLSRAAGNTRYPFIPIIGEKASPADLPPFAQQFQGVIDPLSRPDELQKLVRAALGLDDRKPLALERHPFVGLASFTQETAHLFYGREAETDELVDRLRRANLLMVVGDSGSGKSSLVRAGLVPKFRGGAFANLELNGPDPTFWQVVEMRPQNKPFEQLVDGLARSAKKSGLALADIDTLSERVRSRDPARIRDAFRDSGPRDNDQAPVKTLLVVDQFEELWTQTAELDRVAFVDALLGVADAAGPDCRIVMTMRRDYFNLCSDIQALFDRVGNGESKYAVRRMSDESLALAIIEPLRLTDAWDDAQVPAFAKTVLADVGDRPGDLALLETALTETWRRRGQHGGRLLDAYVASGGVSGALANAAEGVYREKLARDAPPDAIQGIFIRLVRLGETGGTTRRTALRSEFRADAWEVVQKMATEEYARLVVISGEAGREQVELIHEALATQWAQYQTWLEQAAADKRVLDALIDDARSWDENGRARGRLARGYDLEAFARLRDSHAAWLSVAETKFIAESARLAAAEASRARWLRNALIAVAVLALIAAGGASWFYRDSARANVQALENETRALAALSQAAKLQGRYTDGVKLALAAWPRKAGDPRPKLSRTLDALSASLAGPLEVTSPLRHQGAVISAAFSPDGARVVTACFDNMARIWNAATGQPIGPPLRHQGIVYGAEFSPDAARVVTVSADKTARIWDAATGQPIGPPLRYEGHVVGAEFSPNGARVVTAFDDKTARIWDVATGHPIGPPLRHDGVVRGAAFSPDDTRVVTASDDNTARIWDALTGQAIGLPMRHEGAVYRAAFSPDGARVVTASGDNTARIWNAATGQPIGPPLRHEDRVWSAAFSPDGTRVVTASWDKTARIWNAVTGQPVGPPLRHEGAVLGAVFSRDGARVITWSGDKTARIWDALTGQAIGPLPHEGRVGGVGFSPGGARVVTASGNRVVTVSGNTARIWLAPPAAPNIVSLACKMLGRNLDTASLEARYGVRITEPICATEPPAPDMAKLPDR